MVVRWLLCLLFSVGVAVKGWNTTTTLSNGRTFPLMGMGVGNLQADRIDEIVQKGVELGVRLIDTAHASQNEALVKQAIEKSKQEVHVVTKVWYTYLGYERTKISVKESLQELGVTRNVRGNGKTRKVHILLHWPRCRSDIDWMHCEEEEENLPDSTKNVGPPPHQNRDAFLDSWQALEDMYLDSSYAIESIGISNFDQRDLDMLLQRARILPHIIQSNTWTLLFDPRLMSLIQRQNIHFQAYNVMNGILPQVTKVQNARKSLQKIADDLECTLPQLVLAWFMQQGVSVIPRTSSMEHLVENVKAQNVTLLTKTQNNAVKAAIEAVLRGQDLKLPLASFLNLKDSIVHIFWTHPDNGEEKLVKEHLQPGQQFNTVTYPGHKFVAYDDNKSRKREFQVTATFGDSEEFQIEL